MKLDFEKKHNTLHFTIWVYTIFGDGLDKKDSLFRK